MLRYSGPEVMVSSPTDAGGIRMSRQGMTDNELKEEYRSYAAELYGLDVPIDEITVEPFGRS